MLNCSKYKTKQQGAKLQQSKMSVKNGISPAKQELTANATTNSTKRGGQVAHGVKHQAGGLFLTKRVSLDGWR